MTRRQKIEAKLDDIVSQIIRKRDKSCITCGCETGLSTGHFMKRRHLATRWSLQNCNAQCFTCNCEDDWDKYREAMKRVHGEEITEQLITTSRADIKFTTSELEEMYEQLKNYSKLI